MHKEPFIQPRFDGPRFEAHTLPISAAKDLAAYEELVLELGKHLYREKHADRKRVPKGFAEGFSLHLERIDDGSARPLLAMMMMLSPLGLQVGLPPEIAEARDLINQVIATEANEAFPANFPKELYSYFNRIGRSLEDGESIEFAPEAAQNKSLLTPVKRKRLALANRETYEAEAHIVGKVEVLDTKRQTGNLRRENGQVLSFSYDDAFLTELKEALGVHWQSVRLYGVGVFDVNDQLQQLKEIEQIDTLPHQDLVAAIEKLADLQDGWLEGSGKAPEAEKLNWLSSEIADVYPDLPYPAVVPSEDGNVVFEWIRTHSRTELEVNFTAQQLELYSTDLDKDSFVEETFQFSDWTIAFDRVGSLIST